MNDFTLGLDEVSTKLDNVLLERLNELELKKKAIAKEIDDIKGRIKFNMGENVYAESEKFYVERKTVKTKRFDSTTFKQAEPEMYIKYTKESESERMTIKEKIAI